ncbi:MAG: HEPN domain-containing protein [Spirochaetaceae bacterium]|nr:HEPN domain-containing protein [Spirochaetaceae bacterium]
MTLNVDDKKTLSDIRFAKAREALADARATLADERLNNAVNRSYYAALSAVRALLILDGVNPESHGGAVTILSLRFIRTKLLPVSVAKDFKTLMTRRTDVDYGDFESTSRSEAEDSVQRADRLLNQIDTVRTRLATQL